MLRDYSLMTLLTFIGMYGVKIPPKALLKLATSVGILRREVLSDHPEASQGDLDTKQLCESWKKSRRTYKPCESMTRVGTKKMLTD